MKPQREDRRDWHRGRVVRDLRAALAEHSSHTDDTLTALSRMLGRSDGYLARFVRSLSPATLTASDHRLLADHIGLDERLLGRRYVRPDATDDAPTPGSPAR